MGCRGVVFSVLFQPRQLTVVSGSEDGEVRVWDLVTKSCVHVLRVPPPLSRPSGGHGSCTRQCRTCRGA